MIHVMSCDYCFTGITIPAVPLLLSLPNTVHFCSCNNCSYLDLLIIFLVCNIHFCFVMVCLLVISGALNLCNIKVLDIS